MTEETENYTVTHHKMQMFKGWRGLIARVHVERLRLADEWERRDWSPEMIEAADERRREIERAFFFGSEP